MTEPRRLHPLSPVAQVGNYLIPVFFGVLVFADELPFLGRLALVVVLLLAAAAVGAVAWFRTTYWFDDDGDLRVSSGLLFRSERRVQLSRLQAVDIHRPLVARIIGLAELRPEVAGGESGKARLAYLSEQQAQLLRNEMIARSAGVSSDGVSPVPEAPERVLVTVPPGTLAASGLLDVGFFVGVVVGSIILAVAILTGQVAGLFGLLIAGGIPLAATVSYFLNYYGFTLAESPDGLRVRCGLLNTRSQTVPPGRVQAVRISQPLLWGRRGWVRLQVNVAGYGGGEDQADVGTMLLPVAPRELALSVLSRVLPGVDVSAVALTPVPRSARWRAPLQHKRLSSGSDAQVWVAHGGWLVPHWDVVPHARTQSVRITQGPWQRRLGVASMHVDSTPGPVVPVALHRDATSVRDEAEAQVVKAREARAAFRPERWMQS